MAAPVLEIVNTRNVVFWKLMGVGEIKTIIAFEHRHSCMHGFIAPHIPKLGTCSDSWYSHCGHVERDGSLFRAQLSCGSSVFRVVGR
jgi:hypothetical protein